MEKKNWSTWGIIVLVILLLAGRNTFGQQAVPVQLTHTSLVVDSINADGSLKLHHAWAQHDYAGFNGRRYCCSLEGLANLRTEEYYFEGENGILYLCIREGNTFKRVYRNYKAFAVQKRSCGTASNDLGLLP